MLWQFKARPTSLKMYLKIGFPLAVLLASCLLLGVGAFLFSDRGQRNIDLHSTINSSRDGSSWHITELPVADSEEMKRVVLEKLNYDSIAYLELTERSTRIKVFLAYWKAGKMPMRLVASHTPDVCWVETGWTLLRSSTRLVAVPINSSYRNIEVQLRTFSLGIHQESVVFVHIAGGRTIRYSDFGAPSWLAPFKEVFERGLYLRDAQYFIRISSAGSMETILQSDLVNKVLIRILQEALSNKSHV
jgi:hypothetical protein